MRTGAWPAGPQNWDSFALRHEGRISGTFCGFCHRARLSAHILSSGPGTIPLSRGASECPHFIDYFLKAQISKWTCQRSHSYSGPQTVALIHPRFTSQLFKAVSLPHLQRSSKTPRHAGKEPQPTPKGPAVWTLTHCSHTALRTWLCSCCSGRCWQILTRGLLLVPDAAPAGPRKAVTDFQRFCFPRG